MVIVKGTIFEIEGLKWEVAEEPFLEVILENPSRPYQLRFLLHQWPFLQDSQVVFHPNSEIKKELERIGFSGNILREDVEYVVFDLEGLPVEACKLDGVLCFYYQPEEWGEEIVIPWSKVRNLGQLKSLILLLARFS